MAKTNPTVSSHQKLRLFLFDEQSHQPARHIRVEAIAELLAMDQQPVNDDQFPRKVSLGLLQSDHAGYASFDLRPALNAGKVSRLYVQTPARPEERHELTDSWNAPDVQTLSVRVRNAKALAEKAGTLPFAQQPDVTDWMTSPKSFSSRSIEVVGQDGCETLLVSNAAVQTYGFVQVVPEVAERDQQLVPAESSPCDKKQTSASDLCFRRGVVIDYETTWRPIGHGLGEVIYSLPLAPCESVKLAIIDWARADEASRNEDLSVSEQLFHNQRRDRVIEEIVRGVVSEWQRGGSVMGAAAGAYTSGSLSIAASIGAGYFTSAGDRNAAAETVQRLADAIAQATTVARRLQSTVVVQASQRETERLQTRVVTNHNHCHALTVLYYEIVRHFLVETAAVRVRDAILLRHPDQTFDRERVLRERGRLLPLLSDEALEAGLSALEGETGPTATSPIIGEVSHLILRVESAHPDLGNIDGVGDDWFRFLMLTADSTNPVQSIRLRDRSIHRAADHLREQEVETFILPITLSLHSIRQVGISFEKRMPGHTWALAGLEVDALVSEDRGTGPQSRLIPLVRRHDINHHFENTGDWWADVILPPEVGETVPTDEGIQTRRFGERLLTHLNDNRHFYNRLLWLTEDPNRRASLLQRYRFEHTDGEGRRSAGRLIDFVDNRIVDVIGDYLVLPMGTRDLVRTLVPMWPVPVQQIMSVPTRGAFAEAKLSNCNACEEINDTRFWDWQQSPCPGEAPDITGIAPGSRARDVRAEPSTLPPSTVGVEAPQAAPDPTGLANILELLGRPGIFRDMSGRAELADVMKSLVTGAVQLSQEQIRQRGETDRARLQSAQSQEGTVGTTGTRGSGASSPSQSSATGSIGRSSSVTERERAYRQADNAVDRAERRGDITGEQGQARRVENLDSLIHETQHNPLAMPDQPEEEDFQPTLVNLPETSSRRRVTYEPGEVDESRTSPGLVTFRSSLERVLYNFGVNMPAETPELKAEHSDFLADMVRELNLTGADSRAQLELIEGYTDLVDTETVNWNLRIRRADTVTRWLASHGVPSHLFGTVRGAPAGELLTDNSTREARAMNRSVLVRIQPTRRVQLPPERLQPATHRSTQWSLSSITSVTLSELIQGTAALFELTDLSLPERPSHYIWFGGIGLGGGATIPGTRIPRLPGFRPGMSIDPFGSGTRFHTTEPLRFEDFDFSAGTMFVAQAGFIMLGYGIGWVQISGQVNGRRWAAVSDEGMASGTSFIWIGGVQTTNVGGDIGGFVGTWTYNRNITST